MKAPLKTGILECIGDTPLLELGSIVPANGARILLKLESENPTGSMKDRMALAMIEAAEADGRLPPQGPVVEYTGGSTGVSLAFVCAVKRHPLHIVSSDAFQREKLDQMRIYGAELEIIHSETGGMTEKLMRDMIAAARAFTERTGAFWTDQMNNTAPLSDYHRMAEEIFTQTNAAGDGIDGFVQSVAPGLRCAASARRCANGGPGSKSLPSNRRSRQFSQAARQARITLKASGWDSWCRYGRAPWPTASSAFPRKKPRPWPFA